MTDITHHVPARLLRVYAAGNLPHAFSLVVAAHVSMCDDCRAALEAEEAAGGVVLDSMAPDTTEDSALRAAVLAALDETPGPGGVTDPPARSGIYPGPVAEALKGRPPRWKRLGKGIRQTIISADSDGTARLLFIPPGQAVPDHGHGGLELTLVLQGSFHDETGIFDVGDVEVATDDLEHKPVAGEGDPCICLAATDAPLRFLALVPRLLQPVFRI